jgi:hypothetical protein
MMPPVEDTDDGYIDLDEQEELIEEIDTSQMTAEEKAIARGDIVSGVADDETKEEVQEETDEEDEVEDDGNSDGGSESGSEDEDGSEDGRDDDPRIPKARLDQVIAQREELKQYAARLEEREDKLLKLLEATQAPKEQEPAKPVFDMDAKEGEALDAMLEGDADRYKQIRAEINRHLLEEARANVSNIESFATKAAKEEARAIKDEERFQMAVDTFSEQYPFLNAGDKDFNEEALVTIDKLYQKFLGAGDSKTEALTEAVMLIAPKYAKPEKEESLSRAKGARRAKAVKKAADAANSTPPETKGRSTQKVEEFSYEALAAMSEAEYRKLPNSIKKKLRGD